MSLQWNILITQVFPISLQLPITPNLEFSFLKVEYFKKKEPQYFVGVLDMSVNLYNSKVGAQKPLHA